MIRQLRQSLFFFLASLMPNIVFSEKIIYLFYRWAGVNIPERARISRPLIVRPYGACQRVTIGPRSFLNINVRFAVPDATVEIGEDCQVASNVSFETVGHSLVFTPGKGRGSTAGDIVVGDRVWIGTGCIVLAGVSIGSDAVVAAGSVVNKNVPPKTVVAGVPAKVIKHIDT